MFKQFHSAAADAAAFLLRLADLAAQLVGKGGKKLIGSFRQPQFHPNF